MVSYTHQTCQRFPRQQRPLEPRPDVREAVWMDAFALSLLSFPGTIQGPSPPFCCSALTPRCQPSELQDERALKRVSATQNDGFEICRRRLRILGESVRAVGNSAFAMAPQHQLPAEGVGSHCKTIGQSLARDGCEISTSGHSHAVSGYLAFSSRFVFRFLNKPSVSQLLHICVARALWAPPG